MELNATGNFSLSSPLVVIYGLFLKTCLAPLTVNAIFISQSTNFAPTAADTDVILREQFWGGEAIEWSSTLALKLNRYNGPPGMLSRLANFNLGWSALE